MDTEIVVSVAQIMTAAATLIVAVFLAGQLVLQRKVLTRAHNDAEIELSLSSNAFWKDISVLKVLSEPLRKAYLKRDQDFHSLSKEDTDVLIEYYEQMYSFLNMEWRLGRLDRNPVYYSLRIQQLMDSNVGQQYYEELGRTILSATEDYVGLRDLADSVYENHAGGPVAV
tara:strand:- start:91 stop:600 length:510 start_codon:yes stop_codon:yes gene_type:complete